MEYIIKIINADEDISDNFLIFSNSSDAIEEYEKMRIKYGKNNLVIYKGDVEISLEDLRQEEILLNIDDETKLKSGYRPGYGSNRDVSTDADGEPKNVWKPKNPESDFD